VVDDRTVRFHFKDPFFDFPILHGTGNVCGAGWVVVPSGVWLELKVA